MHNLPRNTTISGLYLKSHSLYAMFFLTRVKAGDDCRKDKTMNFTDTLETERLILRPIGGGDFDAMQSWASNPDNTRYMAWGPNTEEQTREYLSSAAPCKDFAVVLKNTGKVIGSCGVYPDSTGYIGNLGWILHLDYWKNGYGTELAGELIRYSFEDLKLGRVQAPCAAVNYGSYRIMERNGMRREALHRKAFWARVDKEWIDEAWYAMLAEDYFTKQGDGSTKQRDGPTKQGDSSSALKAINRRKSIRSYLDKPVEKELLERIAAAGDKAPLGAALTFRIITDKDMLAAIDSETHERMLKSGIPFSVERASLPGYRPLYSAPVLIIIASDPERGALGAAAAAENMIIAATDLGLGSCFVVSPIATVSDPAFADKLDLPDGCKPLLGVLVGYADDPDVFSRQRTPANIAYIG